VANLRNSRTQSMLEAYLGRFSSKISKNDVCSLFRDNLLLGSISVFTFYLAALLNIPKQQVGLPSSLNSPFPSKPVSPLARIFPFLLLKPPGTFVVFLSIILRLVRELYMSSSPKFVLNKSSPIDTE
jgi:hypothetical protein